MEAYLQVERQQGETYSHPGFAIYRYDEFPESSVLAGQVRRTFMAGGFETEAAALAAYPGAEIGGSYIAPPAIPDAAPDWLDPEAAGESWNGD